MEEAGKDARDRALAARFAELQIRREVLLALREMAHECDFKDLLALLSDDVARISAALSRHRGAVTRH
jgi:hypothetical protein